MISGFVEVVERGSIRGWAYDSKEPARRLRVELVVDNFPVVQAAVDIQRPDLAALNIGRTDFAFDLKVPPDIVLDLSRMVVRAVGEQLPLPFSDRACAIDGALEIVSPAMVGGWVWHIGHPADRLALEVQLDHLPIATGKAELFRPDLANAHIGDGHYGFRIAIAVAPDQVGPGRLKVVEQQTGMPLLDFRMSKAQRAAVPRAVPPPKRAPQVVLPAPAAAPTPPSPSPQPTPPMASPKPAPPAQPAPVRVVKPVSAPAPVAQPPGRIRIEQEPSTITLSREAAEALREAMGLGGDEGDIF